MAKKKTKKRLSQRYLTDFIQRTVKGSVDYGKEVKIGRPLFDEIPNQILWDAVNIKCKSLLFFYSDYGKEYLKRVYLDLHFNPEGKKEELVFSTEKYGENVIIKKEKKTIKDFLTIREDE